MRTSVLLAALPIGLLAACAAPDGADTAALATASPDDLAAERGQPTLPWSTSLDAQGVRAELTDDGALLTDPDGGTLSLRTATWGRAAAPRAFRPAATPAGNGGLPTYDADGITEWWRQRPEGFEQGWTIEAAPPGDGPLELTLEGDLASVGAWVSGDGALLTAADGSVWSYAGVRAWDADGRDLPALIDDMGGELRVVVDDRLATYPIEVDPVITTAAAILEGSSNGHLGNALAGGDVNGDGYSDLIVGSYYYSYRGVVYVYYGAASGIATVPDVTLYGNYNGRFGWDVQAADFNNDGYDDVVVSEDEYANGTVYVFHGASTGLRTTASTVFSGTTTNERMGHILGVGDFNGDHYADLLAISQRNYSGTYGAADIHYGGSSGLSTTVSATLTGGTGQSYGYGADGAGDVNNDGYDDAIVCHYEAGSYYGRAWVYRGSGTGLSTGTVTTITGPVYDTYFGRGCGGIGDVNGDGYDDVGVGASGLDVAATDAGAWYIYYGSSTGVPTSASATYYGTSYGDRFGWMMDGVGDLDGDGYGDAIVSAYLGTVTTYGTGAAYVYSGSASGLVSGTRDALSGGSSYEAFGSEVAGVGDINGDGHPDVAVGQDNHTGSSAQSGAAYLYWGRGEIVDADGDGYDTDGSDADCNDGDASIHPGATEVCDGADEDCDGVVDDGVATTYYRDYDGDGFGSTTDTIAACSLPTGYLVTGGDCDDGSPGTNPAATEVTGDNRDQDCDGVEVCFADADHDGYGTTTTVTSTTTACSHTGESTYSTDCDDTRITIHPMAVETVADGADQDCDGGDTCYADADRDTFGSATTVTSADLDCVDAGEASGVTDCDDTRATSYPGAPEATADGLDQDCDGGDTCWVDADRDGAGGTGTTASADMDCVDTGEAPASDDCNDASAAIRPGATETVADGVDDDCDGGDTCYVDADRDTFGASGTVGSSDLDCTDAGEASGVTDCDDSTATVYPGAPEVTADGVDQDCDAGDTCARDGDRDGYGGSATVASVDLDCGDAGEATTTTDCEDADAAIHPGAAETLADGIDQDCNGGEVCYTDADGDTWGISTPVGSADLDCTDAGESAERTDCDDADAAVYPEAPELVADGADQDCDGGDACYVDGDGDSYAGEGSAPSADLDCADAGESATVTDCDDADGAVHPGATEAPADLTDQDCDGSALCYADGDADGYGTDATVESVSEACDAVGASLYATDCDDADPAVSPGAEEVVGDGVDEDCDGGETCWVDGDGDGYGGSDTVVSASLACDEGDQATVDGDCDDADPAVSPAGTETAADGVDGDCDGAELCYVDADGDGFGTTATTTSESVACDTAGVSTDASDCDDAAASTAPGAAEACNGVDDNCDGAVDEGLAECESSEPEKSFCGCASTSGSFAAPAAGLAALLLVRRRRSPLPSRTAS